MYSDILRTWVTKKQHLYNREIISGTLDPSADQVQGSAHCESACILKYTI